MQRARKLLFLLAVIGLGIGLPVTLSRARVSPLWTIALPIGVVSLELFMISRVMEKETARFDAEQRLKPGPPGRRGSPDSPAVNGPANHNQDRSSPARELTKAHAHSG